MMAHRAVLHSLCVLGFFQKGLTALIETQRTVRAAVGDKVYLNCHLMHHKDVQQVTWQKILPQKVMDVACYSERFGETVNSGFQSKLEFEDAGLQNSTIVLRRVMEEDEGCYRCLFNIYSEGAVIATTCLQLYELHGPFLHVRDSTVVSCSATARPAPTVTLTVPHYNSTSVTNTNGTVTVITTAELSRLHSNSAVVGCAVRVLPGPLIEVSTMIPEVKQSPADGFDEESGSTNNRTMIIVSGVVVIVCLFVLVVVAVIIFIKWKKRSSRPQRDAEEPETPKRPINDTQDRPQRDSEEAKTPQKGIKDTHGFKTPLMKQDNELRQRSTGRTKTPQPPKTSSLKSGKKLSFN